MSARCLPRACAAGAAGSSGSASCGSASGACRARPAILVIYAHRDRHCSPAIGCAVMPPMVQQSQQFWKELPDLHRSGAGRSSPRGALISPDTSFKELLQQAPTGSGDAVTMVIAHACGDLSAACSAMVTILLLTFYLLVESQSIFDFFVRLFPRDRQRKVAEVSELVAGEDQRVARRPDVARLRSSARPSAIGFWLDGRAVFLRARGDRRHRRDDPDGRSAALRGSRRRWSRSRSRPASRSAWRSSSWCSSCSRTTCSCRR